MHPDEFAGLDAARQALRAGRIGEAAEACLRLVKVEPRNAAALQLLGEIDLNCRGPEPAIRRFREVLALEPDSVETLQWIALAYRTAGKLEQAIESAQRAIELAPADPVGHLNLGMSYLARSEPASAIASFETAVSLDPTAANIRFHLGLAFRLAGRTIDAADQLEKAIGLAPNVPDFPLELASLRLEEGDATDAERQALRSLLIRPHDLRATVLLSRAQAALGKVQAAKANADRALEIDPGSAQANETLGIVLQMEGRFQEAEEALHRAAELDPLHCSVFTHLVRGKRTGEADQPLIERMEGLAATSLPSRELSLLNFALGKAHDDLGRYEEAMGRWDEANRLVRASHEEGFDCESFAESRSRMIEFFSEEFLADPGVAGSPSDRPVFIVGMVRSGTTLMEQILASHPGVTPLGERPFWIPNGPSAIDFDAGRLIQERIDKLAEDYLGLMDEKDPTRARVTEKTPLNILMLGLMHVTFPNARILHMRRHPVDVCLSIYSTPNLTSDRFGGDKRNIVFRYRQYERLAKHWRSALPPSRYLEVSYEDLVRQGRSAISPVLDFCGLPWSDSCVEHDLAARPVGTPSLWQVRQPLYESSIEKWRRYEPWLGEFRELLLSASYRIDLATDWFSQVCQNDYRVSPVQRLRES